MGLDKSPHGNIYSPLFGYLRFFSIRHGFHQCEEISPLGTEDGIIFEESLIIHPIINRYKSGFLILSHAHPTNSFSLFHPCVYIVHAPRFNLQREYLYSCQYSMYIHHQDLSMKQWVSKWLQITDAYRTVCIYEWYYIYYYLIMM